MEKRCDNDKLHCLISLQMKGKVGVSRGNEVKKAIEFALTDWRKLD